MGIQVKSLTEENKLLTVVQMEGSCRASLIILGRISSNKTRLSSADNL